MGHVVVIWVMYLMMDFIYVGTKAATTGQRYCIDGAGALIFKPQQDGSGRGDIVMGDFATT